MNPRAHRGVPFLQALLLAGVAIGGCDEVRPNRLPSMVNVCVRMNPAGYVSLLVSLHEPRRRPTLRATAGLVSFDGEHLVRVDPAAVGIDVGGAGAAIDVDDLVAGRTATVSLQADAPATVEPDVVEILDSTALVRIFGPDGPSTFRVDLFSHAVEPSVLLVPPSRFSHYGPGHGFAVALKEEDVLLELPDDRPGTAIELLDQVRSIVSVHWIPGSAFPPAIERALDRTFKQAESIAASNLDCSPDGDLSEWRKDTARGISSASQVLSGDDDWSGGRDGSFAVALRSPPGRLCGAVRVRDDEILPGQDRIELYLGGPGHFFPVPDHPSVLHEEGLTAAFTDHVRFGVGMEFCADEALFTRNNGVVPFRVLYVDQDSTGGATVLATAPDLPWPSLAGVRLPGQGPREGRTRW
jgi:hypothetical protein